MKNKDLTIVLTLRGRHLHTLRWLWHANRTGFPFHVIIADGEVHPVIERLASDPATFPNLSFEYHRHNDLSFSDFYTKCADTIRRVKTKYVMMSDNDDFLIPAGIQRSIAHLDRDSDYVCAGGRIPSFSIDPSTKLPGRIIGTLIGPEFTYTASCRDIAFSLKSERVMDEINRYQVIYYHAYRTSALQTIFDEIKAHDFSDLTVHEHYCALRTATLGKIKSDPSALCYLRQAGTTANTAYWVDWVHNLLRSRLPQDYRTLAAVIAKEAASAGDTDSAVFGEIILNAYAGKIRHTLGHTMMRHRFPRLFQIKQKLLWLKQIQIIPTWYKRRRKRNIFWASFANDCAEPSLLTAYRSEFGDIETSLQGHEFLSFVKSNALELLTDS